MGSQRGEDGGYREAAGERQDAAAISLSRLLCGDGGRGLLDELEGHLTEHLESDGRCPVERALSLVGAKWTLLILHELMEGTRRFSQLERALEGASPKVLTERLREMEAAGLVTRTAYAEVPPRVEYALTDRGRALRPIIESLGVWGATLPAGSKVTAP